MELIKASAFINSNLTPLSARRSIALLGVIDRSALREGPPQLQTFFRVTPFDNPNTRISRHQHVHSRRLGEWQAGRNINIMKRSALESIRVYTLLQADVVIQRTLKQFQQALSGIVKYRVVAEDPK